MLESKQVDTLEKQFLETDKIAKVTFELTMAKAPAMATIRRQENKPSPNCLLKKQGGVY